MRLLKELFENNRVWAARMEAEHPGYFERLTGQQAPQFFWIGCSDSRVPANQITGLAPGEVFVHRNVANVVAHSDMSCLAAMQFAVEVLRVRHILVVGHYGCGGVRAALREERLGFVDEWLAPVREMAERHSPWLQRLGDEQARWSLLCELNVLESARAVTGSNMVRRAWERGQGLAVHGWIYGIHDGLLRDLGLTVESPEEVEGVYASAVERILSGVRT